MPRENTARPFGPGNMNAQGRSLFAQVLEAIGQVEESLTVAALEESEATIRVIGEYSSGKTRFLRNLLGDKIPPALAPVSSLETQTLLPLEIMHGEPTRLELVRRAGDWEQATVIEVLDHFPEREELAAKKLVGCRLRLFVDEPRLVVDDNESRPPKLLRLIDQPGWNSEDDIQGWENLGLSDEWENLALVYVCKLYRLDSDTNQKNLAMFIDALQDGDLLMAKKPLPLFFVLTDCPPEERRTKAKIFRERVEALIRDPVLFTLKVAAADFAAVDEKNLEALRASFWGHVLPDSDSSPPLKGAALAISRWRPDWALRPWLAQSAAWLAGIREMARGLKPHGKYMGKRTMAYFEGLSGVKLAEKAVREWRKELGPRYAAENTAALEPPDLPPDHPLRPWLDAW